MRMQIDVLRTPTFILKIELVLGKMYFKINFSTI